MFTKTSAMLQRGVSLVELIMFLVIVSSALAGILLVMNEVTGHSGDSLIRKQALAVAESMLEEIQLQPLNPAFCTGALGADAVRTGAGCANDYNGYSTTAGVREFSPANPVVSGLGGYNISGVDVRNMPGGTFGGTAIPAGSGVQITVTVTDPTGAQVQATGYRAGN